MFLSPKNTRRALFAGAWACLVVALVLMLWGGGARRQIAMIAVISSVGLVTRARYINPNPIVAPRNGEAEKHGPA